MVYQDAMLMPDLFKRISRAGLILNCTHHFSVGWNPSTEFRDACNKLVYFCSDRISTFDDGLVNKDRELL